MRYKNLIFDLYGTLVDIHTDQNKDEVWEKTALYMGFYGARYTPGELKAEYENMTGSMARALAEEGKQKNPAGQDYECFPELSIEKIFAALFQRKGVTEGAEELGINAAQFFRIFSMEYIRLYPGVKEALRQLKRDGHRLWLLSNAQRVFTAYELCYLELADLFDDIYISSDYGYRKPDPRFFHVLIEEKGLEAEQCLMIGNDLSTDIAGARQAGFSTFYIHSNISPKLDGQTRLTADYSAEGADWHVILGMLQRICI